MEDPQSKKSLVLYCLIRRKISPGNDINFLVMPKSTGESFPVTKLKKGETIYAALVRPMEEDLGLAQGMYYLEEELPMIENDGESPRYPGLKKHWYLYPVDISLTDEGWRHLNELKLLKWQTLDEIRNNNKEPNIKKISNYILQKCDTVWTQNVRIEPSMDARASRWSALNGKGVRILKHDDLKTILDTGNRAFNLRVADPYLAYQKQGLGFTWSFFTPKDKQDVHVHGLPAVEIYGIQEGEMLLWHKPMNERGAWVWTCDTLRAGDWAEVEPLHCHFACWTTPEGMGTVVKAAAGGELAGVGKLGIAGKTTCQDCNVKEQCLLHPQMKSLIDEYKKPYDQRDYAWIQKYAEGLIF